MTKIKISDFTDWHPKHDMLYENGVFLWAELNFTTSTISYVVENRRRDAEVKERHFLNISDAISEYNKRVSGE